MSDNLLYIADDGKVTCVKHTPPLDSDEWIGRGYQIMDYHNHNAYVALYGKEPTCHICQSSGENHVEL